MKSSKSKQVIFYNYVSSSPGCGNILENVIEIDSEATVQIFLGHSVADFEVTVVSHRKFKQRILTLNCCINID